MTEPIQCIECSQPMSEERCDEYVAYECETCALIQVLYKARRYSFVDGAQTIAAFPYYLPPRATSPTSWVSEFRVRWTGSAYYDHQQDRTLYYDGDKLILSEPGQCLRAMTERVRKLVPFL